MDTMNYKDELRKKAEKMLHDFGISPRADLPPLEEHDLKTLVEELKIHQIELEHQNDELRRAQVELEASRDRFSDLFDFSPVGYVSMDEDFRVIEVNLTAAEMLGTDRTSIKGTKFTRFIHEHSQDDFHFHTREITRTGEKKSLEIALKDTESQVLHVLIESKHDNRVPGLPLIKTAIIDITHRKERDQLRSLLSMIVESSNDAIISITPGGIITSWNKGAEQIYGYKAEEVIGKHGNLVLFDENQDEIDLYLQDILHGKDLHHYETNRRRKDGSMVEISLSVFPILDEGNKVVGASAIARDISEQKKAMKALRASEAQLRYESDVNQALANVSSRLLQPDMSLETIAMVIHMYSLELTGSQHGYVGSIESITGDLWLQARTGSTYPGYETMKDGAPVMRKQPGGYPGLWGHSLNEKKAFYTNSPLNHPARSGLAPEGHASFSSFLSVPAVIQDQLVGQIALANSSSGYTDRDLQLVLKLADLYAIAILRKRYEVELVDAREKAEESDRQKSAFLTNMSHEIRTPMNAIIGFAELLSDRQLSEDKQLEFLSYIRSSGQSLLSLINDIIDISKIEAGKLAINPTTCHVNRILKEVCSYYGEELHKKGKANVEMRVQLGHDDPEFAIVTDTVRFRQILSNLVGNAIKFTDQGFIEIGYTVKQGLLEFHVKDTGIGIPVDKHDIIFKRFGQVLNTRERNLGGTGLGLAISKNLSHLLGGDMWMISGIGQGSTFYFTLPDQRVSSLQLEETKTPSIPGQFDWRDKTILVAEDFEPNYMFIEAGLLNTRARVIWAKDGQEAIDVMREHEHIDAVLMDIQMPKVDGLEATRQIKQMKPGVPVIAQTAYAMENDREKFIEAGCDDYISKPIKLSVLLNTLDQHMNPLRQAD